MRTRTGTTSAGFIVLLQRVIALLQGDGGVGQWCGLIGVGVGDAVAGAMGSSYGSAFVV
jgi:hypothetical protein